MRYLYQLVVAALLLLFIYAGGVYSRLGILTEDNVYLCSYIQNKISRINTISSPKLLIVAGSNAYVGLSAKLIETELGVSTYNFGINAGMGPGALFYYAKQVLFPGDVVLLPLEYSMYAGSQPSERLLSLVQGCGKQYLTKVPLVEMIHIIYGQPIKRLWDSFFAVKELGETLFGSRGDATYNLENMITDSMRKRVEREKVGVNYEEDSRGGVAEIERFIDWCRKNNVKVLATWPNTVYREVYKSHPFVINNLAKIKEMYLRNDVEILGEPYESMFDGTYFYDTSYHLHQRGVKVRTEKLLPHLKTALDRNSFK